MKIGIINSGICNLGSVTRWISSKYDCYNLITKKELLSNYDLIIFPGVGSFDSVMTFLKSSGLDFELKNYIKNGGKFLGICLGFQILFSKSDEGKNDGLCIINSEIKKLNTEQCVLVPHVGFNEVELKSNNQISKINLNSFYFTHTFGFLNDKFLFDDFECGITNYGKLSFTSIIFSDNIIACQFHPEKSSKAGLKFLEIIDLWLKKD